MKREKEPIDQELDTLRQILGDEEVFPDVPEGYFDQLEADILNKTIYAEGQRAPAKVVGMQWVKAVSAIAAVSAIVFFGVKWMHRSAENDLAIQLTQMSNAEIDRFIDNQIALLSYDDLHNYLATNVNDIETEMLFSTEFIDEASALNKVTSDVHDQVVSDQGVMNMPADTMLLDEEMLKQMDDQVWQDYLNDATLFDDFAL